VRSVVIGSQLCVTCELRSDGVGEREIEREIFSEISAQVAPLAVSGNVISKETPLYFPLQRKKRNVHGVNCKIAFVCQSVVVGLCVQSSESGVLIEQL
jgi:hypothetical protein